MGFFPYQLREQVVHLSEELNRERVESNYFQQRRDKINAFGEIAKRQLEEARAQENNSEKDMEEDEKCHQAEIRVKVFSVVKLHHRDNKAVQFQRLFEKIFECIRRNFVFNWLKTQAFLPTPK